jgi:hypothetical protein
MTGTYHNTGFLLVEMRVSLFAQAGLKSNPPVISTFCNEPMAWLKFPILTGNLIAPMHTYIKIQ